MLLLLAGFENLDSRFSQGSRSSEPFACMSDVPVTANSIGGDIRPGLSGMSPAAGTRVEMNPEEIGGWTMKRSGAL